MITLIELAGVLLVAAIAAFIVWRRAPRRDMCQPLTNQERLLAYINRRAEWERQRRVEKMLQRQRVEKMLEQRWLRSAPGSTPIRWSDVTVPQPRREAA